MQEQLYLVPGIIGEWFSTPVGIVAALICIDVVSGILKAIKNGDLCSSVMREGFIKKVAEVIAIFVMFLIGLYGVPAVFELSVAGVACFEFVSIFENIFEINPDLKNSKVGECFRIGREKLGGGNGSTAYSDDE